MTDYFGYLISFVSGVLITLFGHWLARRRQKEESKKDIKVYCDLLTKKVWYVSDIETTLEFITISAVNDGSRPITIIDAGFELENGKVFRPGERTNPEYWKIPQKIDVGEMAQWAMTIELLLNTLKENKSFISSAWVFDATEIKYRRKISEKISGTIHEKLQKSLE